MDELSCKIMNEHRNHRSLYIILGQGIYYGALILNV